MTSFFTASITLVKSTGTGIKLSKFDLSKSDFKSAKEAFLATFYVFVFVIFFSFFKTAFVG